MKTPRNLALASYNAIKEMMMSNAIAPGQRLILVDLAEKLGVSRTPVNNALSILAKEGYLKFIPNQGYSVRRMTREDADNLYEIREALELSNIGKALQKMTDRDAIDLETAKLAYENGVADENYGKLFLLDTEFHATVVAMAGNSFLVRQYRDLCQMIALCFRSESLTPKRLTESIREHDELFASLRRRDVESVKILIRRHNVNDRFAAKSKLPAKPLRAPKAPEWTFAAPMA